MADVALRQKDYRTAVPRLRQILADQPEQQAARHRLIECYNELGEKELAAEEAKRLTGGPDRP